MSTHDNDDEALVREAVRAADPLQGKPVPPLGVTPQQLRQRQLIKLRRRRVYATQAALVCVMVLMFGFGLFIPKPSRIDVPWPTEAPSDRLASMQLYALAETLQPSKADGQTGAVSYIELLRWQPVLPRTDEQLLTRTLERSWRAADGSGHTTIRLRQGTADQVRQLAGARLDEEGTLTTHVYGPGQMPAYFQGVGAPHTSALRLAGQLLAIQCGHELELPSPCPATSIRANHADQLFDAVILLHQTEIPDRQTRQALLTALGALRGLRHELPATDPVGRYGLGIRYGLGDQRWSLVWDRTTGELLAAERWTADGLRDHLVYLDRARLDHLRAAAMTGLRDGAEVKP